MIFGEKVELKVYVNQNDSVSDIQTPSTTPKQTSATNCTCHAVTRLAGPNWLNWTLSSIQFPDLECLFLTVLILYDR
jgi:hypothetical protein